MLKRKRPKRAVEQKLYTAREIDEIVGDAARRENGRVRLTSGQRRNIKLHQG